MERTQEHQAGKQDERHITVKFKSIRAKDRLTKLQTDARSGPAAERCPRSLAADGLQSADRDCRRRLQGTFESQKSMLAQMDPGRSTGETQKDFTGAPRGKRRGLWRRGPLQAEPSGRGAWRTEDRGRACAIQLLDSHLCPCAGPPGGPRTEAERAAPLGTKAQPEWGAREGQETQERL